MDTPQFPADLFLDQVITALTAADAATLRELESVAPTVSTPGDWVQFRTKNAVLFALLGSTARNLRLLCRIAGNQVPRSH